VAVYKKTYRRYQGPLSPAWSQFLVLPRYALQEMRQSRFLSRFFLAGFLGPLICALFIYLHYNLGALKLLNISAAQLPGINARFFLGFLGFQSMLAFFLTAFVGPGLVSPDLANNALPLYLSRPFSRWEYVLGKMSVLLLLLSLLTWAPGLLLFALQGYLVGGGWAVENLGLASALFWGSWVWILLLSFLAPAISAWVKWKPAAGALFFGFFFVAAGFGAAINEVLRTHWGNLINVSHLIGSIWAWLFQQPLRRGSGAVFFRIGRGEQMPIWCCWAAVAGICLFCLYLLARKIRGAEVVR